MLSSFDEVSNIVDDVIDLSHSVKENCEGICELNASILWSLNSILDNNWEVSEERVNASTPSFMVLDIVSHLVGSKSFVTIVRLSNIIRVLRLVKVGLSILTIPFEHVAESVLDGETIASDVVSINLETGVNWVLRVNN